MISSAAIPLEVVDCIASARPPSEEEIHRVADRIWREACAITPGVDSGERSWSRALRAARAALQGVS